MDFARLGRRTQKNISLLGIEAALKIKIWECGTLHYLRFRKESCPKTYNAMTQTQINKGLGNITSDVKLIALWTKIPVRMLLPVR